MTVTISKAPKKKSDATNADWGKIKNDFIDQNLDAKKHPKGFTLKQAAAEWDVAYVTLKKRAAPGYAGNKGVSWQGQVKIRRDKNNKAVTQIMSKVQVFDEFEIRYRHTVTAHRMFNKAAKRLTSIEPDELTVDQAIKLMALSVHIERMSAGLPETSVEFLGAMERGASQESRTDRIHKHNEQRELGKAYVAWKRLKLKDEHGEEMDVPDVTADAPELLDGA